MSYGRIIRLSRISATAFGPTLLVLFSLLTTVAQAGIFGISFTRLNYDIVGITNPPQNMDALDVLLAGSEISTGIIAKTASIPKGGLAGILYDMGYACQPGFNPNTTLPLPEFYGLSKIALIRRGGPTDQEACTFRIKLLNALNDGAIAALVYNLPGSTALDGATAVLSPSNSPISIPGLMISYESGAMFHSYLKQTANTTSVGQSSRVRVQLSPDQRMPVVWEFILIVVVVLLGISFTVSVILHCRLYALRQRIRMDAMTRGDVLPNGTIRMRKVTLDKATLDKFSVRIYGKANPVAESSRAQEDQLKVVTIPESAITSETTSEFTMDSSASVTTSTTMQPETRDPRAITDIKKAGGVYEILQGSRPNLSRANSLAGQSLRSLTAIAAATALDANTPENTTEPNTTRVRHELVNDACAICIDEFSEGEEVRKLPCGHEFHCECIDPWLMRKSSTCPLCKYDCLVSAHDEDEDDDDQDERVIHDEEGGPVPIPNDRLMEFVMGPGWVASRTRSGYNGTSTVDRIGYFFGSLSDRIRGRPVRERPTTGRAEDRSQTEPHQ
ncbi:hypothetical protein BGW38_002834, partial [Lunasporangiospora selenospora]